MHFLLKVSPNVNLDHHLPFIAPAGNLRVAVPGHGWRAASILEAALLSPRVQHRVTGWRDEG